MKRQKKKQNQPDKSRKRRGNLPEQTTSVGSKKVDRRQMLLSFRNWGVLALAGLGIVWYFVDDVTASIAEHDLSRIGNGKLSVVQIHDPQCPRCRALQRETRSALRRLDDPNVQYLVASIKMKNGQQFAARHGVSHITLVLLDGEGKRKGIIRGNRSSHQIYEGFRIYFGSSKNKT